MLKLYLARSGWQVLGQENYPEETTDFRKALARAKDGRAQVILAVFDMPSSRNLVMQWHEMKPPAVLCGFISPASGPDAWSSFRGGLEGCDQRYLRAGEPAVAQVSSGRSVL
jgi:branched-chain amino acid transport system substrate-binding protein